MSVTLTDHHSLHILNSFIHSSLCFKCTFLSQHFNLKWSSFCLYSIQSPSSLKVKIKFIVTCPILLNWFSMLAAEQEVEIHSVKTRTSRQQLCTVIPRARRVIQPLYLPTEVPMNSNTLKQVFLSLFYRWGKGVLEKGAFKDHSTVKSSENE